MEELIYITDEIREERISYYTSAKCWGLVERFKTSTYYSYMNIGKDTGVGEYTFYNQGELD